MARQIGKMLNAREPKIVNGPEILNKYVGASEENIRKLFADAEKEVCTLPAEPWLFVEDLCSTRQRVTRVVCISSSSMSWTPSASSVAPLVVVLVSATVLSTSYSPRHVDAPLCTVTDTDMCAPRWMVLTNLTTFSLSV